MTTRSVASFAMPDFSLSLLSDLFSLTKPRLSSLVIFTSALGLFLAPGHVGLLVTLVSIVATSGLVGGACMINCYMEKDIDALMERTKNRPLPSGRLQPETALWTGIGLIVACLGALLFVVNPLTALLGLVATLVYVFLYTPMKKKTSWALFAGAIPGALPPLMGWTSVTNSIGELGVVLFGILFIWQLPHFLSISIYHMDDYNSAELKTVPAHIGIRPTLHRMGIYTLLLAVVSLAPYWIGAATVGYLNSVGLLGASFFAFSLLGYRTKEKSVEMMLWARRYFYGSIIYLPCVFILMLFFR